MKNTTVLVGNLTTLSISVLEVKEILQISVLVLSLLLSIVQILKAKKK